MTWYPVDEPTFRNELYDALNELEDTFQFVTGPGRSGAIASVYASHYLCIPFIPYKSGLKQIGNLLIVDTVEYTGRTLQKAQAWYEKNSSFELIGNTYAMNESLGHYYQFWYETEDKTND